MISDEILKNELQAEKTKLNEENQLAKDIKESVNVSGILDNCFFHSLALYYLGNNISFPEDLFTMKHNHDDDSSPLQKLQAQFKNTESLEIFNKYTQMKQPNGHQYPNHLVEKAIVLGVFLRSWFVEQLREDAEHCKALFEYTGKNDGIDEKQITFMSLIDDLQSAMISDVKDPADKKNIDEINLFTEELDSFFVEEELTLGVDTFKEGVKDNPIYLANKKYFDESLMTLLSDSESEMDKKDGHWSYWDVSGYLNYCNYLNEKVKISPADVESVLRKLEIPYSFYSYSDDPSLIAEHASERAIPAFKLAFHATKGHYYLLKNDKTDRFLQEYQEQQKEYDEFRTNVLATDDRDKVSQSHESSALFLAATLPFEVSNRPTLELLVERVEEMSQLLLSQEKREDEYANEPEIIKKSPRHRSSNKEAVINPFSTRLNLIAVGIENKSTDEKKENASQTQTSPRRINKTSPRKLNEISPRNLNKLSPRKLNERKEIFLAQQASLRSDNKIESKHEFKQPLSSLPNSPRNKRPILSNYSFLQANQDNVSDAELEHFDRVQVVEKSIYALYRKFEYYQGKKENPPQDLRASELAVYVEKYQKAETAAFILSNGLNQLLQAYKRNRDGTSEPYEILKMTSLALIKIHRPELAKHRDNDRAITNFIESIFGLGVIYGFVQSMLSNFRYAFLKPDGADRVDTITDALENIPCPEF
jgi:hypothetical protein